MAYHALSQKDRLTVPVDLSRDHCLGKPDAPVTLLEYGDYECPDCGRAYPHLKALQNRFPDQLLFVFRHFPQFSIHHHASTAAQAAEVAALQNKFWPMHDLLYLNQDRLDIPDLTHYALRIGLEVYQFESALSAGAGMRRVEEDFRGGETSGVRGTPTLFINALRYTGEVDLESLAEAIEAASNER